MKPERRWIWLLLASYTFYACWKVEYLLLIMLSTGIDYYCGRRMGALPDKAHRKKYLYLSLLTNLGLLFSFKYFYFFTDSTQVLLNLFNITYEQPVFDVLLPVGISFYTFQTLSYTIDVYYGKIKAEHHLGKFALFVSFFPQLVAGPIERAKNLLPQMHQHFEFDYNRVKSGLLLMGWGFFKKVVIADRAAIYAELLYNNPEGYYGFQAFLGNFMFVYQIYCDFSGYSDIAIGAALVLGFKLMENFRRPYFSTSFRDLWRRWHISLSTWFKDYVYIPLGGSRVIKWRWYYNLFITFTLSGLWHGAAWNFVVWGAFYGVIIVFEVATLQARLAFFEKSGLTRFPRFLKSMQIGITFFLFIILLPLFRADTIGDAWLVFKNMADFSTPSLSLVENAYLWKNMCISLVFIFLLETVQFFQETRGSMRVQLAKQPTWLRWTVYTVLVLVILNFGVFTEREFIYFQF